jgi:hypothetical protein
MNIFNELKRVENILIKIQSRWYTKTTPGLGFPDSNYFGIGDTRNADDPEQIPYGVLDITDFNQLNELQKEKINEITLFLKEDIRKKIEIQYNSIWVILLNAFLLVLSVTDNNECYCHCQLTTNDLENEYTVSAENFDNLKEITKTSLQFSNLKWEPAPVDDTDEGLWSIPIDQESSEEITAFLDGEILKDKSEMPNRYWVKKSNDFKLIVTVPDFAGYPCSCQLKLKTSGNGYRTDVVDANELRDVVNAFLQFSGYKWIEQKFGDLRDIQTLPGYYDGIPSLDNDSMPPSPRP